MIISLKQANQDEHFNTMPKDSMKFQRSKTLADKTQNKKAQKSITTVQLKQKASQVTTEATKLRLPSGNTHMSLKAKEEETPGVVMMSPH